MKTPLYHPQKQKQRGQFFPDRCRLEQDGAGTKSGLMNARIAGNAVAVAGLSNLACKIVPGQGEEVPTAAGEKVISTHTIAFQFYHAAINESMKLVDEATGETYNILLAGHDGTHTQSILKAQKVKSRS